MRVMEIDRKKGDLRLRKLVLFNSISLDGFFEGPNRDISWHNFDEEINEFAIDQIYEAGEVVFGRVTYQHMADYWSEATDDDPVVIELMNTIQKVVFSRTLDRAEWKNTRLIWGRLRMKWPDSKGSPAVCY